jgi:hypothetical protein
MIDINRLIETRIADTELLHLMISEETNPEIIMVWKYHINLNREIIINLIKGNYETADTMMREIRRSTIILENYLSQSARCNARIV